MRADFSQATTAASDRLVDHRIEALPGTCSNSVLRYVTTSEIGDRVSETRVVRIDQALVATAEAEGDTAGRSTSAQLTYWARLGRAVEASGVPASAIRAVLGKQAAFDDLSSEDQAVVSALWAQEIEETLDALDMADHHEAVGTPYAELDDDGNVVVVEPNAKGSVGGAIGAKRASRAASGAKKMVRRAGGSKAVHSNS